MTAFLPRISVVTPSFNQGRFLAETIESVLDQNYPNLEYMVLDGGSTDDSKSIIERYSHHLSYWRSHPDDGQAAALREGFDRATGDILAWLNSDDCYAGDALNRVAKACERHGTDVVVAGGVREIRGRSLSAPHFPSFQNGFDTPAPLPIRAILDLADAWARGDFFYQPEVFFPSGLYRRVGGLDKTLHFMMDTDLWIRFAHAGASCVVVPEVLALFRVHADQKTADRRSAIKEAQETMRRYLEAPDVGLSKSVREGLLRSNATVGRLRGETRRALRAVARRFP